MKRICLIVCLLQCLSAHAQLNTNNLMIMGRNALYYEDYVLSIQRFNMVITAKPFLWEPYFFRALAKFYLEDYAGAEQDLTIAADRNPYAENIFVLRGLCRVNLERYDKAEEDYKRSTHLNPLDNTSWHNMVLCQMELEENERADSTLDIMIKQWPKDADNCNMKAQLCFARQDTVNALDWLEKATDLDAYNGPAWSMKAMVTLGRGEWKEGEEQLDKAIVQLPRNANLYINRALARYHQNNLRGAMNDYDQALEIAPGNYLGHFNRGLLRAQVGDDNKAIEDFNFVLEQEPDNMIALYNRALLLDQTGQYREAIRDITKVINEWPEFWTGYSTRAAIRRKIGDTAGAERDEFKVLKAEMDKRTGNYRSKTANKTRKASEKDPSQYDKLVVEDHTEAEKEEYASEYRGKVQNKHVPLEPLAPMDPGAADDSVQDLRQQHLYEVRTIYNLGTHLIQQGDYARAMDMLSQAIEKEPEFAEAYYNRGIARLLAGGNREDALRDLSQAGEYGLYSAYSLIKRYSKEK